MLRGAFAAARQRISRLPIFNRLLLGNSAVIVVGAIGGTLITHQVSHSNRTAAADLWLIGLFATAGIFLSLLVNYWIVKWTLRPLHDLRQAVDRVQAGRSNGQRVLVSDADPDLSRLAAAVESMLDRVEVRTAQLRALSERAILAQEEERKRIARGLHDDIGQTLSLLMITLERIENAVSPEVAELRQQLGDARRLANRTLEDLRKVVYGLRPTMLDDLGLGPAIRWYARSSLESEGVRVKFDGFDEALRVESRIEIVLFRIAQEAINNIRHHAQASTVTLHLSQEASRICLRIDDDGHGFDLATSRTQALRLRHFGLLGIQERAELVGGEAEVTSVPGQGTRVEVTVPLRDMVEMAATG